MNKNVTLKVLSSLTKVFIDESPATKFTTEISGFKNEIISFQVAYNFKDANNASQTVNIEVISEVKNIIRVRRVGFVPVGLAAFANADDNYLRYTPGLYPDLLSNLKDNCPTGHIRMINNQWGAIWIDVEPSDNTNAGKYPIEIVFKSLNGEVVQSISTTVQILNASLPKQELIRTNWFHTDCLAEQYNVAVFSERHWEIIENFITLYVKRGLNMILTPTFTPPLDTAENGERLTVQLVDVCLDNQTYSFNFDKLDRWVDICKRCGIEYYEICHLFSQWGAKAAPKIMATVNGEYKRIFGFDTSAVGNDYKSFLAAYLPAITKHLHSLGIADKTFFHISDEPSIEQLNAYKDAKDIVEPFLKDFPIIDALSSIEFYKKGILTKPIPANDHIEPFLDEKINGLWTYYCISQNVDVSNLFIAMPSARNRIFGVQLYKFDIEGTLQWGYNFYKSQFSGYNINPYACTDSDGFTPAGDPFQVYPGADGKPEDSIRFMVTAQAGFDLRAMKMLEELTSKDYVMSIIEKDLHEPITFKKYPASEEWLLSLRSKINCEIMKKII